MRRTVNTFSILALAAGILLILLEINTFRRVGEVAWFWLLVAGLMIGLGVAGLVDKPRGK
jgi:hypothetical protein